MAAPKCSPTILRMRLTREVRFCLSGGLDQPPLNSWAGWPACDGIVPFLLLRATISGTADAKTGFLCNITAMDRLLREVAIPHLQEAWANAPGGCLPGASALLSVWGSLEDRTLASVKLESLELHTTPFQHFCVSRGRLLVIVLTESFEFSASHRLCCSGLSDEENLELFGKCSNPNGHGHNYVVEISVAGKPDGQSGAITDHREFQRTVQEQVIDRLDHKHLNTDCSEFDHLNPTVENITRVIWALLDGCFGPAKLHRVRVYETPKTYADYWGDSVGS